MWEFRAKLDIIYTHGDAVKIGRLRRRTEAATRSCSSIRICNRTCPHLGCDQSSCFKNRKKKPALGQIIVRGATTPIAGCSNPGVPHADVFGSTATKLRRARIMLDEDLLVGAAACLELCAPEIVPAAKIPFDRQMPRAHVL